MLRVTGTAEPSARVLRILDDDPRGLLFLHTRWVRALVRAYPKFRLRYLVLEDDGEPAGVLPLVTIPKWGCTEVASLPFGSYGGPVLVPGADAEGARHLVREFCRLIRRPRVFRHELTLFDAPDGVTRILDEELGEWRVPTQTWLIELDQGQEALWESYAGRARTSVRKAVKSGVTAAVESGPEAVAALYALHRAQGRTRPVPWHHRRAALQAVAEALGEDARIWIARQEGKAVCGALVVSRPGREAHPWVTGATPESRPLNAFPFLMHRAMEDAAERGCRLWNFGPSAGSETVEYFKTAFGGAARPIRRYFFEAGWVRWGRRFAP